MVDIPYGSGRRGQGTKAQSQSVTLASDHDSVPVSSTPAVAGPGTAATAQRVVLADNGGATDTRRLLSAAATTNATSVKASAGVVYRIGGSNTAGAGRYLKLYDKATAPTVGTDTPVQTFFLAQSAAFVLEWPAGRYFANGIAFAFTTGQADADTGALTAGDVQNFNLDYR